MEKTKTTFLQHFALAGALGLVAGFGAACSGETTTNNGGDCQADPDGSGLVADGDCCFFSINCGIGSICNTPDDDFFDATETPNTCLRIICESDAECDGEEECNAQGLCSQPVCQNDNQCSPGQTCQGGGCATPPGTDQVASCEVVTRDTSVREGGTLELAAVAKNANGKVLPSIPFTWASSNTNAVAVAGNVATGGSEQGTASQTAIPEGRTDVACAGAAEITNFPNVEAGKARVVVVAADNGAPVADATVVLMSGGELTAQTSATGVASFDVMAGVDSVTVMKDGWQYVSVIAPGGNDVFIPLPRKPDTTVAGGFRGTIDISSTKKADIKLGLAGPSIPSNLLDFGLDSLIGDFVPTEIDAPELGLEDTIDLPGGLVLGLGSKTFTSDELRCQGVTPADGELGCFVAQTASGPAAGWAMAGQLKLSQITSIANELSNAVGGDEELPIGDILTAVLPLLRGLNHGVTASVLGQDFPKINKDGQTGDCSDADLADYGDKCRGDFAKYTRQDIAASVGLDVLSAVSIPVLPQLPGLGRCAEGAVLLAGAALEGRGIVPLGLTAGIDALDDTQTPDCKVAGVEKPFGDNSETLSDGEMPLSMAPLHSGIEGSQVFLLAVALDPSNIASATDGNFQLSALIKRVDAVAEKQDIGGAFPDFPEATISKGGATVAFKATSITGSTMTRTEIQSGDDTWLVYAPGGSATVTLPNVAEGRALLTDIKDSYVLSMGMDGTYGDIWAFGSGKNLDRLVDNITSFVVQQCSATAGHPCELAD